MSDAEKLVAWVREGADEIEKAHAILDESEVPRDNPDTGNPFTLAARIAYRYERADLGRELYEALRTTKAYIEGETTNAGTYNEALARYEREVGDD